MEGLVLAHLGQGIAVEHNGNILLCQPLRRLDTVAVGDNVVFELVAQGQGRITEILPRRSLLARPARGEKIRPVAANIDTVFVVFAVEPDCDFLLVDQYLAVCEHRNINAALLFNKADLPSSERIEQELETYQSLGYALYRASANTATGLDELKQVLNGQVSLLAGQSGVGKSSLTNALIPDKDLKTTAIGATSKMGKHTTTAATLYHLPTGGDLIDSPGVAIFGLANFTERDLANGYKEFQPLIHDCQFNDCRHVADKGCAVRAAAESGEISMNRYQRFLKLREKM